MGWGPRGEITLKFPLRVHLCVWLDVFAPVCICQTGAAAVTATSSSSRGNTSTSVEWEGQLHRSAAQATFLLRLSQLVAINYSSVLESEISIHIFHKTWPIPSNCLEGRTLVRCGCWPVATFLSTKGALTLLTAKYHLSMDPI